jgi:hypothetical protein
MGGKKADDLPKIHLDKKTWNLLEWIGSQEN